MADVESPEATDARNEMDATTAVESASTTPDSGEAGAGTLLGEELRRRQMNELERLVRAREHVYRDFRI